MWSHQLYSAYRVYMLGQLEVRLEEEDGHAVSHGAGVELGVERDGGNLPVSICRAAGIKLPQSSNNVLVVSIDLQAFICLY